LTKLLLLNKEKLTQPIIFEVKIGKNAENARNYTQCDSLLVGDKCGAHTFPYVEVKQPSAQVEHEATTSNK
jgi:Fe-S cluster assembly protein SufB